MALHSGTCILWLLLIVWFPYLLIKICNSFCPVDLLADLMEAELANELWTTQQSSSIMTYHSNCRLVGMWVMGRRSVGSRKYLGASLSVKFSRLCANSTRNSRLPPGKLPWPSDSQQGKNNSKVPSAYKFTQPSMGLLQLHLLRIKHGFAAAAAASGGTDSMSTVHRHMPSMEQLFSVSGQSCEIFANLFSQVGCASGLTVYSSEYLMTGCRCTWVRIDFEKRAHEIKVVQKR